MSAKIFFVAFVGATLAASAPSTLLPGSSDLNTSYLGPVTQVNRYVGPPAPDSAPRELYHDDVAIVRLAPEHGKVTYSATRATANSRFSFSDTLIFHQDGLQPLREVMHASKMSRSITYLGDSIVVTTQMGDSAPRTERKGFPMKVFGFNQLEQIVQSLPLRAGYVATVPLYSEGSGELEIDTVAVTGKNSTNDGWIVRFADPAIVSTYTINPKTRAVDAYQVNSRKGGVYTRMK